MAQKAVQFVVQMLRKTWNINEAIVECGLVQSRNTIVASGWGHPQGRAGMSVSESHCLGIV